MKRTWGYVALGAGGTPQPVFSTKLTTALSANQGMTGTLDGNTFNAVVTSTAGIINGDKILIEAGGTNPERFITQQVVNATTLKLRSEEGFGIQFSHAANVWVQLVETCVSIFIQCKPGNSGLIYIGNSVSMVKATGVGCILSMLNTASGVQPLYFADPMYGGIDGMSTADYWFDGTTGDNILPSFTVL